LFQKGYDSVKLKKPTEIKFKVYDPIFIKIYSETLSQDQAALFNVSVDGKNDNTYTVEVDSTIQIPILGKIQVVNKTPTELISIIKQKLAPFVKDPGVLVKLKSFKVQILGDIKGNVLLEMNDTRPTVLDAISKVGGFSIDAKKDSVFVIREENDSLKRYFIDVRNVQSIYNSPAYQLQQNDIIYAQANDFKYKDLALRKFSTTNVWMTYVNLAIGLVSILAIIIRLR
jgi:polysaccharide biosynthesis/export protein